MRYASWIVTVGFLALAGCSSSTSPYGTGGGGGQHTTITVGNDFFSPTPDTIAAASGFVTFSWATPSNGHGVTWDSGPGGDMPPNAGVTSAETSFFVTGLQPGRYEFHCPVHGGPGTGMHGTIVVR